MDFPWSVGGSAVSKVTPGLGGPKACHHHPQNFTQLCCLKTALDVVWGSYAMPYVYRVSVCICLPGGRSQSDPRSPQSASTCWTLKVMLRASYPRDISSIILLYYILYIYRYMGVYSLYIYIHIITATFQGAPYQKCKIHFWGPPL